VAICLKRGADLHIAQLMPMPLTVSCFSKIQIGFTFLVPAHPGCPGQMAVRIRVGVLVLWLRFRVGLGSGSGTWGRCSGGGSRSRSFSDTATMDGRSAAPAAVKDVVDISTRR